MNNDEAKFKFTGSDGLQTEAVINVGEYKEAGKAGITLSQHLEQKYGKNNNAQKNGTILQQMMASSGMYLNADEHSGLKPPTMGDIMDGTVSINMGSITRPDNNTGAGARLLFPEIVMQVIESELRTDHSDFLGVWNQMLAQTQSINGPKFEQPIVNIKAPEGSRNSPVGQLSEPEVMVGITTSDVSRKISTKAIGLTISDEALQATTLDLVNLIVSAQARQERVSLVEADIAAMVAGDTDRNESALASVAASTFDPVGITANSTITHKGWIKYLRANYRKMNIDYVMCSIDTALAIEGRSGKPTYTTVDSNASEFSMAYSVENLGIKEPKILLLDEAVIGADTIVGIDSRNAIRRVINATASYSAIEQFVLRKAQAMRFDYGEMSHKLYTDAWSKTTLTGF